MTTATPITLPTFESTSTPTRLAALEVLRILAALAIVYFHFGGTCYVVGFAGVPTFLALSIALAATPSRVRSAHQTLHLRATRLLLPWVVWSTIYGLAMLARLHSDHTPLATTFHPSMLLTGPSLHLWYLPFAFLTTSLTAILIAPRHLTSHPASFSTFAGITTGSLMLITWPLRYTENMVPLPQYAIALPAVPLGLALASLSTRPTQRTLELLALTLFICLASLLTAALGASLLAVPYLFATPATALAFAFTAKASSRLLALSSLTLGLYILHPLIARTLIRTPYFPNPAILFLSTIALSLLITAVIRRTPLRPVL